jgi:hypothetical protein
MSHGQQLYNCRVGDKRQGVSFMCDLYGKTYNVRPTISLESCITDAQLLCMTHVSFKNLKSPPYFLNFLVDTDS